MKGPTRYRWLTVLVTCMAALISACVPTVEAIFRPIVLDGEVLDGHCPPVPRTVALFQRQGVVVSVRSFLGSNDTIDTFIAYEVPEGKVITFIDTYFTLLRHSNPLLLVELKANQYSTPIISGKEIYGKTISPQALSSNGWPTLYSSREGYIAKTIHMSYLTQGSFQSGPVGSFSLVLPRFTVNGVYIPAIKVNFSREVVSYLGYFNC